MLVVCVDPLFILSEATILLHPIMKIILVLLLASLQLSVSHPLHDDTHSCGLGREECPPFWTRFQDNCYRFFGHALSWDDAEANCQRFFTSSHQAHLVSIHSEDESRFVYTYWHEAVFQSPQFNYSLTIDSKTDPRSRIHLGINDLEVEGKFVWTDGTDVDYTEWG